MKRLRGFLAIAFFVVGPLLLGGCSGRDASTIPQTSDPTFASGSRSADAAAVSAAVDETAPTAGDVPIPGAAPPDVAGIYGGTFQERTPHVWFVERGTLRLVLHQIGPFVNGTITVTNSLGRTASYAFTGTAAKTTKGAILQLSIAAETGRTIGAWAKVIGAALFGKGWADPDGGTSQTYQQLLFTLHKT
jgi:hypothetical protein